MPETLIAENADCTLTVTIAADAALAKLHVRYLVHNRSKQPLYLLNQLWKNITRDAANRQVFEVLPDLANVQVGQQRVTVGKAVVDVPYLMLVEVRHIPCMTRVAPGAEYEETVDLPLPLMPYTVYEGLPAHGPLAQLPLYFELGYLVGTVPGGDIRQVATPAGLAYATNPFPASHQSLIQAGPFQAAVPVVTRQEEQPLKPDKAEGWSPWH
jgi:hypothetical protein